MKTVPNFVNFYTLNQCIFWKHFCLENALTHVNGDRHAHSHHGDHHGDRHAHIHGDRVHDHVHICKKKIDKISHHFLIISYTTLKSMNFATLEIRDE